MTIEIFLRISFFQIILSAIVVVMSVINFNRRGIETKLAGLTFLYGVITAIVLEIFPIKGKNVNIPQSLHAICYLITVTILYSVALRGKYRAFFTGATAIVLVISVVNLLFFQQNENNTYSRIAGSVIIIIYGILYCYRLLVDLPVEHLQRVPMFWFNSGILIYNAGSLFLFLFTTYLVEVLHNDLLIYWSFHNIFNIVQTVIVLIGIWQDLRNTRLLSSSPSVR